MTSPLILASAILTPPTSAAQCELMRLAASDGAPVSRFGTDVAVEDGRYVVGAPYDDGLGVNAGTAYLFDSHSGTEIKLVPSDPAPWDFFGTSVAIDGGMVAVGATNDDDQGNSSGSVYVFDASSGQQLYKLTASDGATGSQFGMSTSIHGKRIAVGAATDDDKGVGSGSAYIFDLQTGQQLFKLTASDGAAMEYFGVSVALHGDRLVVGASLHNGTFAQQGAAYVFDVTTGQQLHRLVASDGKKIDHFGIDVDLDSRLAIVGTVRANAAYVYDLMTGQELFKLAVPGTASDAKFGMGVAVEGRWAVVGAPFHQEPGFHVGSFWAFDTVIGEALTQVNAPVAGLDGLGQSLSMDGEVVLAGAPFYFHFPPRPPTAIVMQLPTDIGSRYCTPANLNSTGASARLTTFGLTSAACNEVRLTASALPLHEFGYFLVSETQGFVPFLGGSQGNLCLGGTIGRFRKQIQDSGPSGSFSIDVDLGSIPPLGTAVQGGETWNFQAWFRDQNPTPTSNFTDGVSITFE